ncbi:MAG: arsenate reductase ArsC [Brachymonas sp.]|nr:arsenate reductase ArsC [Brachymonas sp.]
MNDSRVFNVLVLCTGNSARSIIGEVLFNALGQGRFKAYSAGSHPAGKVHPVALEMLQALHLSTEGLRSKNWDEFSQPGAPQMDFIITVCDRAAGEACPLWLGSPITAHWGFPDPAAVENPDQQRRAFQDVVHGMTNRIRQFVSLPLVSLDALAIKREMDRIGQQPIDTTDKNQPV